MGKNIKMDVDEIAKILALVLTVLLLVSEWLGMSGCTKANSITQGLILLLHKMKNEEDEKEETRRKKVVFVE
jgi:hypothetical protein